MHCTNVNLEYKSANKALTTELDRYKEEVKDLKEMQSVDNSFSGSNEQYAKIEYLKQTFLNKLQEKDSFNENIRESKPKLYDGNVILKMDTIVIPDFDETLMLCEESHSKMLLKVQDPLVVKHKVNTKPINYAILNNDYNKRFVRQSDLYSEHAYWKATSVPALDPSHSSTTIKVEVPKELPKVSMVYTSLKELKRYLTGFDLVVKERTTATAITKGTWGQCPGPPRMIGYQQTPSSNSKNKVEAHPRNVKSSLNKRNGTVKVNGSASVQNSKKHENSDYVCINGDCNTPKMGRSGIWVGECYFIDQQHEI
ncbi:hypothetical protein Tco_1165861 [Tanacetum coccineum]